MVTIGTQINIEELSSRIGAVAERLAQFGPETPEEQAIQLHLVAALYALRRAFAFELSEVPSTTDDPGEELRLVAAELAENEGTQEAHWLTGFYLAAAEHRLSLIPPKFKNYRKIDSLGLPSRQRRSVKMATQTGHIDQIAAAVARLEELLGILLPE